MYMCIELISLVPAFFLNTYMYNLTAIGVPLATHNPVFVTKWKRWSKWKNDKYKFIHLCHLVIPSPMTFLHHLENFHF